MASNKLKITKKYTFNPQTNQYVFHTENEFGRNYVFSLDKVDTILRLYSNYDKRPVTMGQIAQRTSTPKRVIEFILSSLGKTHDTLPFSDEKLEVVNEEVLVDEMLAQKAFNVYQKFEKKNWEQTVRDADKWNEFQELIFKPFEDVLEKWTPPKYKPTKYTYLPTTDNKELIVGCSDWHYGLVADERYLYNQKEWDITKTDEAVQQYAQKIKAHIVSRQNPYERVTLLFLGDMIHGLDGYTDKGTKLEAHPLKEEQLERAFDSVIKFIEEIISVHPNIRFLGVPGNHSSLGDYILYKMLSLYYKEDNRIDFEYTAKRHLVFRTYDNVMLAEHGYSAVSRDRLPRPGKARETYISNLFLSKPYLLKNSKRMYYFSADQHHHESYEYTNVEGYMFSTLVGGCRHADNSGYKSRPRQSALVVSEEGIVEVLNFYFD